MTQNITSTFLSLFTYGLDVDAIVGQLMAVERQPQLQLQSSRAAAQNQVNALQAVNTTVSSLRTAASALSVPAGWSVWNATSSDPTRVAVSASSNALGGSLTFTVDQLARAHSLISNGTFASTGAVVAAGPLLLAKGFDALGVASVAGGPGLALGAHSIEVTQASTAAVRSGTSALAASTIITTGVNDTLDVTVDGVAQTLTLASGTYSRAELAAAVVAASSGDLTAAVDGANSLRLSTLREGSAASIQVTGGTALADLRLAIDPGATTGTDALVTLDGQVNTVTDLLAGATISLTSGTGGTVDAVLAGGLRVGTRSATNVALGDGSLSSLVAAVNAAGAGIVATAVKVGEGAYRLQLESTTTGASSVIALAPDALGGLATLTGAQDAALTVGSGLGAYTITSATNAVSDVLPGVTLNLLQESATAVNIQVQRDAQAVANKVEALVNAANSVVNQVKQLTAFDASSGTSAVLTGDATLRRVIEQLGDSITTAVTTSTLGSAGIVGVSIKRDGTYAFDAAKFTAAYQASPDAVSALFVRGGTASNAKVTFASATDATRPGVYTVTVTTAAERAEALGAVVGGGVITAAETIELQVGDTTVSYAAGAGESLTSIATGLGAAAAAEGLGLVVGVESGALVIRSQDYGSAVGFAVRSSVVGAGQTGLVSVANVWETHGGVDVVGSINGAVATGLGQILQAPLTNTTLAGLAVRVTATAADVGVSTDFGTLTYVPGVAARVAAAANAAVDPATGMLSTAVDGREAQVTSLDARIEAMDTRLARREQLLRAQFTRMQAALAQLQGQSQWLGDALNQLSGNGASGT